MARRTLFIIRTNSFDLNSRLLGLRLATVPDSSVVYVADERRGLFATGNFAKISNNETELARLGIDGLPEDWGWFCGDMCYYLAADAYPDMDRYVLIESDVYIPLETVQYFAEKLASCEAECAAHGLGRTARAKRYSRDLSKLGLNPNWGCIFPISYATRDIVLVMQALRIEALRRNLRLNDEAILCGAVQRAQASFMPLEQVAPDLVPPETFDTNPPHLLDALFANTQDKRIYHPAVSFEKVVERIYSNEKNYNMHRLRRVLRQAEGMQRKAILNTLNEIGLK